MIPDDNWTAYDMKRCIGPLSFKQALDIEKKSQNVSTGEDTDNIMQKEFETHKRIIKKKRLSTESSDGVDDEENNSQNEEEATENMIKKQIVNKRKFYQKPVSTDDNCSTDNDYGDNNSKHKKLKSLPPLQLTGWDGHTPNDDVEDLEPTDSTTCKATTSQTSGNKPLIKTIEKTQINLNPQTKRTYCPPSGSVQNNAAPNAEYASKAELFAVQTVILREIKSLKKHVVGRKERNEDENEEETLLPELPITNAEDLESLEDLLSSNAQAKNEFKKYIKSIGGDDEGDRVRCALRALMTDEVANHYSWSGQRKTKPKFQEKIVCTLLIDTILKSNKVHTKKECQKHVKVWLQHASDRLKRKNNENVAVLLARELLRN